MEAPLSYIRSAFSKFLKTQPPARIIATGFALLILLGAALLSLPFAVYPGVRLTPLDALFTATSAVCVTGLVVVDTADTFSMFGQIVIAVLIQIGGLGVASIGMGVALVAGRRISLKGRSLVREALNVESLDGMVRLVRAVLLMTLICEAAGAVFGFPAFASDHMPLQAVWLSIFHSIASFNNAGFDVLGSGTNLIPYRRDILLNIVTDTLVIAGGIGFMVMLDIGHSRGNFRKMTLHTKVVLTTTTVLLFGGALLLQITDKLDFMTAFFQSMTARTAGFSTVDFGNLSNAGLLVIMILMFVGASPGSTGGGIKTTTFFVLMQQVWVLFSKRRMGAFHRRLPDGSLSKAATIALMGLLVVSGGTFALCMLEPQTDFVRLLFEQVSAYSTAGLSTGITAGLCPASRVVLIFTMFIGRVGAVTLLTLWVERPEPSARYTEEAITIG
ncbi:TrkH family potassium uptake protein [Gemmiger sp.]